ncbi:MAG: MlaE family ABC transporter permease [Thermosulfidibacteraceae bacterium]|jgi:phospholipid/cholesterol/gamma-HCH transport system permease protein
MVFVDFVRRLGAFCLDFVISLGRFGLFLFVTIFWIFAKPIKFKRVLRQIHFIGYRSISIVALTGIFTGMVLALESYYALNKFGAESLLGPAVALSMLRELGPVISALMVVARAGSAITAEIGIMKITEQIDALEVMALNPFRYIMVPNLIASLVSFPLLCSIFNVVGIFGGYVVSVNLLGLSPGTYFGDISHYVKAEDINMSLVKSIVFGLLMFWVCCYEGYHTEFGAEGVSRATTRAVVIASILILVMDYVLTSILF